ncbi:MAG: EAL domain-containing protein [Burkholderiaceae bacterium]|nr:EAL domain-containing protein [Burkholderiaceae bacterium]
MQTKTNSLQYQIEKKLISIVGWSLALTALAVLIIAVLSLYIYRVSKLEHVQELVITKVSTEVSGKIRDMNVLAESPLLWAALTDSGGREAYLEPLFQKINQNAIHKIELLDDRGRPVIESRAVDINIPQAQQLISHTVQTNQSKHTIETAQDGQSLLLTTLVVNAPFIDTPLGILLLSFDLNKLIETIDLPKGVTVNIGMQNNLPALPKQGIWIQQTEADFLVSGQSQKLALHLTVQQSALNSLFVITFCFVLILLTGALLLHRLKKWSLSFARNTTARLNALLEQARDIVAGKEVTVAKDEQHDEISLLFTSLQQMLSTQQVLNKQLSTFSRIFDNAAEAIMVTDMNGDIIDVNPALLKITGQTKSQLLGQKSGVLYRDIHQSPTGEAISQHLISQSIDRFGEWRGETYFKDVEGRLIPVMLSASRLRAENGQHLGNIALFSDIRPLKQAENQLRELSYNDQLTGMPNYRAFVDHITPLLAHPDKDFSCALIFIDLDHLKIINDKYGHEEGDLVIIKLSEHLKACLPEGSFLCRRSGDEFIALIHNKQQLPNLLQTLRQLAHTFTVDAGISEPRLIHTSFSAGAAIYPDDAQELNGLLTAADMALRVAKETGRSQLVWYSKNIQARAQRLNTIHEKLTLALTQGLIIPYYQPCVELSTGRILGFEALARWTDAELGTMSPGEFIEIAEQTNLINLVTVAILNKVMADKPFIDAHFKGVAIAVNISPHFFVKQEITTFFANHLERDVDCLDGLVLELTESELSQSPQSIQLHLQLQMLIGMGLKLAIDDFGKGYSSLSRLGSLPFQKLKIDRDFVRDIDDQTNQKIVKSIIALGTSLGLEIIAEGVETELQREVLMNNGCHLGQGFLFSKALPLADILKLDRILAAHTPNEQQQI